MKKLKKTVKTLRGENGCPWDRALNYEKLNQTLIEECYELINAVTIKDIENIKEELGDLLLHIALYVDIAEEKSQFTYEEVEKGIVDKLIRRHPHVFSDVPIGEFDWEKIKSEEPAYQKETLKKITASYPPLLRAEKIIKKAIRLYDYDIDETKIMWEMIENIKNLQGLEKSNKMLLEGEIGQILLDLAKISVKFNINMQNSLTNILETFINKHEVYLQSPEN